MSAKYTVAASYFHWLVAAPLIGSVGCVLKCQQSPKEEKGKWMWRHKSLGLLTGIIVAPRLGYRLFNAAKYKIGHPTGTGPIEGGLANLSHAGLYAFMTIMPATGIASKYNNELISTSCKIRSLFSNIHLHIAPYSGIFRRKRATILLDNNPRSGNSQRKDSKELLLYSQTAWRVWKVSYSTSHGWCSEALNVWKRYLA